MRLKTLRPLLLVTVLLAGGTAVARRLGYKVGGRTIVRCGQGHLFTTIWIPGVKLKALDLGIARFQFCPVGRHWTLVFPVREPALTEEERLLATERHDIPLP